MTGLRTLLESLQDEAEPATASLARIDTDMAAAPAPPQPPADPYQLTPFDQWHQWKSRRRHHRPTRSPPPCRPRRAQIHRVVVSVNMDVDTGLTCAALTNAYLEASCITGAAWHFPVPADPTIKAMVMAEFYRHTVNGAPVWKLRAVGQGWSDGLDGLDGLARAYGVQVD
ncbi:TerD family protein [Actinomadura nitritigenes]|uniref:TerD family protein n=1 Tax=Actinomadura nitritigenes TaxID=134602 RepID=UPI0036CF91C6